MKTETVNIIFLIFGIIIAVAFIIWLIRYFRNRNVVVVDTGTDTDNQRAFNVVKNEIPIPQNRGFVPPSNQIPSANRVNNNQFNQRVVPPAGAGGANIGARVQGGGVVTH